MGDMNMKAGTDMGSFGDDDVLWFLFDLFGKGVLQTEPPCRRSVQCIVLHRSFAMLNVASSLMECRSQGKWSKVLAVCIRARKNCTVPETYGERESDGEASSAPLAGSCRGLRWLFLVASPPARG